MNTSHKIESKARTTSLEKRDLPLIIRENLQSLKTSYVLLDEKKHEVLVEDGSAADMRFRQAPAGDVVPVGTTTEGGVLYRLYLVNPSLL